MSMQFLQDPPRADACARVLDALAEQPDANWYVLCDSSFPMEPIVNGVNCYATGVLDDLIPAAPVLVPLAHAEAQEQVARWLSQCASRPMLGFVATQLSAPELVHQWRRLHMVQTEDGERYLLRIADTRAQVQLQRTLRADQWAAWTRPLLRWLHVRRTGEMASLPLAPPEVEPATAPLRIDMQQIQSLTRGAEADALDAFFQEFLPDMRPDANAMLPSQWHGQIEAMLAMAREYGVERLDDKLSLMRAIRWTDGACLTDERLPLLLRAGGWRTRDLSELLLESGVLN